MSYDHPQIFFARRQELVYGFIKEVPVTTEKARRTGLWKDQKNLDGGGKKGPPGCGKKKSAESRCNLTVLGERNSARTIPAEKLPRCRSTHWLTSGKGPPPYPYRGRASLPVREGGKETLYQSSTRPGVPFRSRPID